MNGYLTAAAAVVVGLFALIGDSLISEKNENIELVKVLYDRVENLESKYVKLSSTNHDQANSILKLRMQLATKYEPDQTIKDYIENMPFPAWVKVVQGDLNSPEFVMWYLNEAYERTFDVTKERYIGKTDSEIWPKGLALEFYKNDLLVLNSFSSNCRDESINYTPLGPLAKGETEDTQVCKWPTTIGGKRAVAGQIMPLNNS